ncbi:MAG: hypothetical protein U5L72_19485 [Bacteroidales bacterium]|nr:hypothetical protein [Bacteroidales bacterium]
MAVITAVPSLTTVTIPAASAVATPSFEETNVKYAGAAQKLSGPTPVGILNVTPESANQEVSIHSQPIQLYCSVPIENHWLPVSKSVSALSNFTSSTSRMYKKPIDFQGLPNRRTFPFSLSQPGRIRDRNIYSSSLVIPGYIWHRHRQVFVI